MHSRRFSIKLSIVFLFALTLSIFLCIGLPLQPVAFNPLSQIWLQMFDSSIFSFHTFCYGNYFILYSILLLLRFFIHFFSKEIKRGMICSWTEIGIFNFWINFVMFLLNTRTNVPFNLKFFRKLYTVITRIIWSNRFIDYFQEFYSSFCWTVWIHTLNSFKILNSSFQFLKKIFGFRKWSFKA